MPLPIELTFEDYERIIQRRRWLILFSFVATVVVTAIYTLNQKPVYSSYAALKIEPPPGESSQFGAYGGGWDAYTGVATQIQVIESAAVAEAAMRQLSLIDDKTPPTERHARIAEVMGRIRAKQIKDTTLVHVIAEAGEANQAAALAQTVAENYIVLDREHRRTTNQQALKNITRRKSQIEALLYQLEEDKRVLAEESPMGVLAAGSLANRLFNLEGRRKVLLDRYTEAHPDVMKLTKEIDVLKRQLKDLPGAGLEVARLDRDLRIQEAIYTSLAKQAEEQRVAAALVVSMGTLVASAIPNPKPIRPNRTATMFIGCLLGLLVGLILSFLVENMDASLRTVEEVEAELKMPVLGLIPHIPLPEGEKTWDFLNWLRKRRHEPTADIPRRLIIHVKPQSPVVEAYHSLRANIESHLKADPGYSLVFSSSGIGEGKSISALNFSLAAVQSGVRLLVIDGDLRRPALHRMMGVSNELGLTEVVIDGIPLESVIKGATDFIVGSAQMADPLRARGIENLFLLTAGSAKVSPTEFFKRQEFVELFRETQKRYDWVIFDCPPLLLFADGLLVGPLAQGVVLCYQAGRLAGSALKRARDELLTVKARPLGIVLNDVRPRDLQQSYSYYRSADYYDYYTREEEDKEEKTT